MQIFRLNRYRFFYPAGLISLVLLPLLGYFYFEYFKTKNQKYIIELDGFNTDIHRRFPTQYQQPAQIRDYTTFFLEGNKTKDSLKLEVARNKIKDILIHKDTIHGLRILFGPETKYRDFIRPLNLFLKEKTASITYYRNVLYVIYPSPPKDLNLSYLDLQPVCGGVGEFYSSTNSASDSDDSSLLFLCLKLLKSFWPSAILFIIMVSLTAQKVVRQFRNRQLPTIN